MRSAGRRDLWDGVRSGESNVSGEEAQCLRGGQWCVHMISRGAEGLTCLRGSSPSSWSCGAAIPVVTNVWCRVQLGTLTCVLAARLPDEDSPGLIKIIYYISHHTHHHLSSSI